MSRRALITGIGGQDGSLLAELLLSHGYEVFGVVRRSTAASYPNLDPIRERIELVEADLLDELSLVDALSDVEPDEIYNLAAPSFVPVSWSQPVLTAQYAAVGAVAMLEATRRTVPESRFYQASSSEVFGEALATPQTESTPLAPVTPYGVAKAYGHFAVRSYRRRYGLFACSGIFYNHESPRRSPEFVTRKVTRAAAAIALGLGGEVWLGDLDAQRDWGFAGDYVVAMHAMLQLDEPDDFVVASGELHSVRELVEIAFTHVGLDWERHVYTDLSLARGTAEPHGLVGDASKAREKLGWRPTMGFHELVTSMVDADLAALSRGAWAIRQPGE
jgi:GDPmannose 4,6-dehydratase